MTATVQELASQARAVNEANGWGRTFQFSDVPNYLALIHSEVTETVLASGTPAKVRELGDVIVRALDLAELLSAGSAGVGYPLGLTLEDTAWAHPSVDPREQHDLGNFLQLHVMTSGALEAFRKEPDQAEATRQIIGKLREIVAYAWGCMKALDQTAVPTSIVQDIIEANSRRAYRHGGLRT